MISESFIVDRSGKELWKLDSAYISWFSDDAIQIEVEAGADKWSRYNYLDRNGRLLCDRPFASPSAFSDGIASVRVGEKYGYINKKCEFVIPPIYSSANGFSEGLAGVTEESGRKGFIDRSGQFVFETKYNWAGGFSEGFALILAGDKAGYMDRSGKVIWEPTK